MSDAQTQDNITDVDGEDSPVITKLRQDLRSAQKVEKETLEELAKLREQVSQTRSAQAKQFVDAAGFPNLDLSVVMERVEGDVTADAVNAALQSIGLSPQAGTGQEQDTSKTQAQAPKVPVSEMGQRVADAASGSPVKDVESRLAAAQSQAEINAIMQEAGLAQSYT